MSIQSEVAYLRGRLRIPFDQITNTFNLLRLHRGRDTAYNGSNIFSFFFHIKFSIGKKKNHALDAIDTIWEKNQS